MKPKKKILIAVGIVLIMGLTGAFFVSKNFRKAPVDPGRYFLSRVELIENRYIPVLAKCLINKEGKKSYKQWSAIYHPSHPPYEVALVRVEFQKGGSLDKSGFIREIKIEKDWQEVEAKYNFSKGRFRK